MLNDPVVIVGAARTPLGAFQGEFSSLPAHALGAIAVRGALARAGLDPEKVDEIFLGNVLQAGQGQAPARQAAIHAGIPASAGAVTVAKVCGSGMQATIFGIDSILAGSNQVVISGGMESMTNAPYLLARGRSGYRVGHDKIFDHMMLDGLEDAYEPGRAMGDFGEQCADHYGFTRSQQDEFAMASVTRAQRAAAEGAFDWEMMPVTLRSRSGEILITRDERPPKLNAEKIPGLKPAFREHGTITAASSSANADGAAALVLMRESGARRMGLQPIARILDHARHSQAPEWFTTAPVGAIAKLYAKVGWTSKDVDLFEINEAFAAVPMAAMQEHRIPHGKVNIHGGACALGHPIGASGARIIVTLLGALRASGGRTGIASLCIGGGEATAIALEMLA